MNEDPEFTALTTVFNSLKELDGDAQQRVIDYVMRKLGLARRDNLEATGTRTVTETESASSNTFADAREHRLDEDNTDLDGISPVAVKWMRRNGFTVDQLGRLFSLGTDEIDLVAKSVPGSSKNARTRSVTLLKGLAAYLSSGVARISNEQIKEACLHYDAFDSPNHAKYVKGMSTELSGSKSNGFTLTARGITAGTELIKEILGIGIEK